MPLDLSVPHKIFSSIVYISLRIRPDRRDGFYQNLAECNWKFDFPMQFYAVDYRNQDPRKERPGYTGSPGSFGCLKSHRAVVNYYVVSKDPKPLHTLEDDVDLCSDYSTKLIECLREVDAHDPDWDGIMVGGNFLDNKPIPISSTLVKCNFCFNTSDYIIRQRAAVEYVKRLDVALQPPDYVLGSLMRDFKFYAPVPFLSGQRNSFSDVENRDRAGSFFQNGEIP